MPTILLDTRQQSFPATNSEMLQFPSTGDIFPTEYLAEGFDGFDYWTNFEVDVTYTELFSEVPAYRFGIGFVGPLSPATFSAESVSISAYPSEGTTFALSYSVVPSWVFGQTNTQRALRTVSHDLGGVALTASHSLVNDVVVLGLETGYLTNDVRIMNEKIKFVDHDVPEDFGTEVGAWVQNTVVIGVPTYKFLQHGVEFEKFPGFRTVSHALAPISHENTKFVGHSVNVITQGFQTVAHDILIGEAKIRTVKHDLGSIATAKDSFLTHDVIAGKEMQDFLQNDLNVYQGRDSYFQNDVIAARQKLKFLQHGMVFGRTGFRSLRNLVNIAAETVAYLVNDVIITTDPTRNFVRHDVIVVRANSVQFYDLSFDESVLVDPLFNEYKVGIN